MTNDTWKVICHISSKCQYGYRIQMDKYNKENRVIIFLMIRLDYDQIFEH